MRVLLVDGGHLASRVRHAQAALRTRDGRRSGVVFGSLQGVSYVRNHLKLDYQQIWVVWDGGRAKYRTDLYPDYKKRTPNPDADELERYEWITQLEAVREGLTLAGVRQVRVLGCEADDLIAIMASTFVSLNDEPIIYSGDNDFHQLADIARIFDPKKDLMSLEAVLEKHGVKHTEQILLRKALQGDPSDGIKGVKGIGDVKALAVLPYVEHTFLGTKNPAAGNEVGTKGLTRAINLVFDNLEIVRRNLKLMRLPRNWEDPPHYSSEQFEAFLSQLDAKPTINRVKFVQFLKSWELDSIIDRLERW